MYYFSMNNNYFDEISKKIKYKSLLPSWIKESLPFFKQIKLMRETLGMTQDQLAKRVNTSQQAIARFEAGEGGAPTLSTLEAIANALEADMHILITPRQPLKKMVEDKAEKKAKEIISFSEQSNLLEAQQPSKSTIKKQIKDLKEEIIKKKRSSLWN